MAQVIGVEDANRPPAEKQRLRQLSLRPVFGFAIAVAAVGGGILIRLLLERALGSHSPYITFFPAVAISVFLGRAGAGLVATFLSLLAANFLFTEPRFVLGIQGRADAVLIGLFLFGSGIIIFLGEAMHRARERSEALRREAKDTEERAQEIVETANEGIWLLDADARVLMVNPRLCEMLGYRPYEMVGRHKWDFVFPEEVPLAHELFERRRQGISEQADLRFRSKEGQAVWIRMAARAWFDPSGRYEGALDMFTVISDRKKLERELEDKIAERTVRLQEVIKELEVFSYSIAHDLRAPLRAMEGISKAVLEDYAHLLPQEGKDFLGRIAGSAKLLDRQILHVLEYNRLVGGELPIDNIDLENLIAEVLSFPDLQHAREHISVDTPIPAVQGNRAALTQAISNLLSNAVKFVAPGQTPSVRIRAESNGNLVRLYFKDSGIGISEKGQQKIFHLFQRLHRSEVYDGIGIGLAIVKIAVERMGGRVGVNSELGRGSEFWIELKLAESAGAAQKSLSAGALHLSPPEPAAPAASDLATGNDREAGPGQAYAA